MQVKRIIKSLKNKQVTINILLTEYYNNLDTKQNFKYNLFQALTVLSDQVKDK